MRNLARVELEPYYTSYIGTLVAPSGKRYCLGELPKFVERTLGVDWRTFRDEVLDARNAGASQGRAIAKVLLRYMREHCGFTRNRQVYAALDSMQSWEYYA